MPHAGSICRPPDILRLWRLRALADTSDTLPLARVSAAHGGGGAGDAAPRPSTGQAMLAQRAKMLAISSTLWPVKSLSNSATSRLLTSAL